MSKNETKLDENFKNHYDEIKKLRFEMDAYKKTTKFELDKLRQQLLFLDLGPPPQTTSTKQKLSTIKLTKIFYNFLHQNTNFLTLHKKLQ